MIYSDEDPIQALEKDIADVEDFLMLLRTQLNARKQKTRLFCDYDAYLKASAKSVLKNVLVKHI